MYSNGSHTLNLPPGEESHLTPFFDPSMIHKSSTNITVLIFYNVTQIKANPF